ncbi:MAG: DMT family transporter [Desulfuromusa sp.]
MTRNTATLVGFVAILLWALLALLTTASGNVPPFQLAAITFAIGGAIGMLRWAFKPSRIRTLRQPVSIWILGIVGLFGYHFAYFTALRNAPPVEASLIAFLWPLLIVLFSALLPGERIRLHHVFGAILGLSGAALIVTKGTLADFQIQYTYGYVMALACALIWSGYSVLSRKVAHIPTDVVTGFCLMTSVLAFIAHLILENTVWPSSTGEWFATVGLGLGPVGLAFYVWDYGVKHGDIQVLGAASYLAPLLSTMILVAAGFAELTFIIIVACLLITGGAAIAAKDLIFKGRQSNPDNSSALLNKSEE